MVIVPGPIPAFRAMTLGVRGRDVRALQAYLAGLGYRVANDRSIFTTKTAAAVRAWQRSRGLPVTGSVDLGDVLFVEPAALGKPFRLDPSVDVGSPLNQGAALIEALADAPVLSIDFGGTPPTALQVGLPASATFPGGARRPVTLTAFESTDGRQTAVLAATGEGLCEPAVCLSMIPPIGSNSVAIEFTLVPETTGPVVPTVAIQTDPAGEAFVELSDSTRRPVRVIVADGGLAIVNGVSVGEAILLP